MVAGRLLGRAKTVVITRNVRAEQATIAEVRADTARKIAAWILASPPPHDATLCPDHPCRLCARIDQARLDADLARMVGGAR